MQQVLIGKGVEMNKTVSGKKILLIAVAAALVAGVLALAGCSCSSQPDQKDTSGQNSETMYTVPNVISLTQADAKKAIHASGLQVGTISKESSDTVPLGSVISQDPKGLTQAKPNSKVNLVVSTGKANAKDVVMPDLKGMTQSEAEKALKDAGLVGVASNPEETDAVAPGKVFKQSIDAGTTVKEGTKIAFTVALAPGEATVPGVIGMTHDDARKAIVDASLGFDSTTAYSDSVAEGKVISQSIAAGTKVKSGTTVSVTLSLGPKPQGDVTVPDVTTYSWSDAESTLHSAGLSARYTGDPAGVVTSQDVAPGTKVAPNTLVTVTLTAPTPQVQVPDLNGMTVSAADSACSAVGLNLDAGGQDGTVTDQSPAAGETVEQGTTVTVTVKSHQDEVAEKFMGEWQTDTATCSIENIGGGFTITIKQGSAANGQTTWTYVDCYIHGDDMVSDSTGTKTVPDEEGGSDQTEYTDGSATFSIDKDGKLIWKDKKEDAGKGLKFDKTGK